MQYINIQGFRKVDFRVNKNQLFYVTDIAAHPGICPASAFVYSFQKMRHHFQDLLKILFALTLNQYRCLIYNNILKLFIIYL